MIRTVPLRANELANRNIEGTEGKYCGNTWEGEVLYFMRLSSDYCFGKGEAESSNLSGSTRFPANFETDCTVRVRSSERGLSVRAIAPFVNREGVMIGASVNNKFGCGSDPAMGDRQSAGPQVNSEADR
jgi:hypothetical protein